MNRIILHFVVRPNVRPLLADRLSPGRDGTGNAATAAAIAAL
jgi:hypothetical protein